MSAGDAVPAPAAAEDGSGSNAASSSSSSMPKRFSTLTVGDDSIGPKLASIASGLGPSPPEETKEWHCALCNVVCTKSCSACHVTHYCSADHQKLHWKAHKRDCLKRRTEAHSGSATTSNTNSASSGDSRRRNPKGFPAAQAEMADIRRARPDAWADGLDTAKKLEWIIDCYRMRMDDDYVWGGCFLHGIYSPEATKLTVLCDFLLFCRLAKQRGVLVLHSRQEWQQLLTKALTLIIYAFEKSDASEKYGTENVFNGTILGGRSLRYTAELVYGHAAMAASHGDTDALYQRVKDEVDELMEDPDDESKRNLREHAATFAEVGGVDVWVNFFSRLNLRPVQT